MTENHSSPTDQANDQTPQPEAGPQSASDGAGTPVSAGESGASAATWHLPADNTGAAELLEEIPGSANANNPAVVQTQNNAALGETQIAVHEGVVDVLADEPEVESLSLEMEMPAEDIHENPIPEPAEQAVERSHEAELADRYAMEELAEPLEMGDAVLAGQAEQTADDDAGAGVAEAAAEDAAANAAADQHDGEVADAMNAAGDNGDAQRVTAPVGELLPKMAGGPRVIALMNQKGGVGKTTTAVNLGAALGRQGYRVLLLDLDPQAHLTLYLGIDPEGLERSMYDLLADDDAQAAQIRQAVPGYAHLHVLPAEVNLAGVESELSDKVVTGAAQSVLRGKVMPIADEYDFILLDCPPSLGLLTINALTFAREVIVPMQAHFLALQGLGKLLETISMLRQGFNPGLLVAGIVLCMHEKQTILAGEVIGDLEAFLEQGKGTDEPWAQAKIFDPPIRRNIKLAESPSFGQSIFDYDGACNGAKDYLQLAASVASHNMTFK